MKVWKVPVSKRNNLFKNLLFKDKKILKIISKREIEKIFDNKYHMKNIDLILKKVLKNN